MSYNVNALLQAMASNTVPTVTLTATAAGRFSDVDQFHLKEEITQQLKQQHHTFRNILRTRDEKIAELRKSLTKSEMKEEHAVGQADAYVQMKDRLAGNRLCKRIGKNMKMREQALSLREWHFNLHESQNKARGERLLSRAGKRMLNLETASFLDGWKATMREDKARERAERIMKRVGKRILHRQVSDAVMGWRETKTAGKERERAERIMRRV